MQELIEKLGIEWQSLLFQVINFLILLFVLRKFVYKPLIGVLEKRKQRIEESMKKAQEIDSEADRAKLKRDEVIANANREAHGIREAASLDAEKIRAQKAENTRKEIESLLDKARLQIKEEKNQAIAEVRKEAASLVMLATEKVLRKRLEEKRDKELVEDSVKELM